MSYDKPLSYYTNKDYKPLMFHLLSVGEGLMFLLIFPDQTTMLYDCNILKDDSDEIIRYCKNNIPTRLTSNGNKSQWIDIFVNSHRDQDHYRGLSYINEVFEIKSIWDSGRSGATTEDSDYKYYMRLRRTIKEKYGDKSLLIPTPSLTPIRTFGGAKIYCLNSSEGNAQSNSYYESVKEQHTDAIVLSVHYYNQSILLTSDSDWNVWKEKIVPMFLKSQILESTILIASHHGSRSFFTDETLNDDIDVDENPDTTYIDHIDYINPNITLISCGEYDQFHHPNKDAKKIYKESTSNEQVYTTNNKGHFIGFIDNRNYWSVIPSRFYPIIPSSISFDIICECTYNNTKTIKPSGETFKIGSSLKFNVKSNQGIFEPYNEITIWWEVSNGGINAHHDHQEIYYKKDSEKGSKLEFEREVSYEGTHLLRCSVKNKKKNINITKIFVVTGIK
jgi:beta-lactamase superfamily II metal-dependent hydrolase